MVQLLCPICNVKTLTKTGLLFWQALFAVVPLPCVVVGFFVNNPSENPCSPSSIQNIFTMPQSCTQVLLIRT